MNSERIQVSERVVGAVVLSLAFAVPLALVLGLLGVGSSFFARVGAALVIEYVLVYGIAEGVQIAFERFFEDPVAVHTDDSEMPEAEEHARGS